MIGVSTPDQLDFRHMSAEGGAVIRRWGRWIKLTALAAGVATVLSACTSVVNGSPDVQQAPDADLGVKGVTDSTFDTTVQNALSDVMAFWKKNYPAVADGKSLPELKGGLYSIDGGEVLRTREDPSYATSDRCLSKQPTAVVDNAFYCELDDSIVWDRDPNHIVATLGKTYGPLIVAMVFAHEFGHAVQARLGIFDKNLRTIDTESQADCASGAWVGAAFKGQAPHFKIIPKQLDNALIAYLQVRDSTPQNANEQGSHGNGFDRLSALEDGIQHGVTYCFSDDYFNRQFTERPYVSDNDYRAGGNESLDQVLNPNDPQKDPGAGGLQPDLNRFWTAAAKTKSKTWKDVKIAEASHPKCGASGTSEFGYCPSDNTVYYSKAFAEKAYYSLTGVKIDRSNGNVTLEHDQPADFALGTLFAVGWGMAVRHQLFGRSIDGKDALLGAVCYTGAYAKDINVAQTSDEHPFALSPPDMDEATSAMLNLVGSDQAYGARGTSGLQRIQTFVKGYNGGLSAC
jgi:predicted metalloprotease